MRIFTVGAAGLLLAGIVFLCGHFGAPAQNPQLVATTEPRSPEDERKGFHLPPGFDIELVAAEPVIHKPINLNFDDQGRLWVTDTLEYPYAAPPDRKPRDTVKVLESTKGDGHFDKVTTFADGLNIPIGVMPISKGAIVHSIPKVFRLLDPEGKGQATRREPLLGDIGFNDTHGMTGNFCWGFDGWIYATHGFSNTSVVKGPDGTTIKMNSGNIYRFKPDGSRLEQVTWGQVNPFGLCFDPLGNLYSSDCETKPIYMLMRGAYYPSFGKPHDGLGFAPEMCKHQHGSSAIAGLVYYAADQFPPPYRNTMFLGNVVTCRINHDRLEWTGSTPRAVEQPDFLTSDDPWFRPVNIKLGPDGALYVADFYNRIIGHYEVPLNHPGRDRERGRIWRIVYRGSDGQRKTTPPRTDWTKAGIPDLVDDLAHPNLTVRTSATNQLVLRDKSAVVEAVGKLMQPRSNPFQRIHGMWVLERLGSLPEATLLALAEDIDPGVRTHAMHVLSERREWTPSLHAAAVTGLKDTDAIVQRAAVDALGQHPDSGNLRPLLTLLAQVPAADSHLVHTVRMALRNQLQPGENWKKLPVPLSDVDAVAIADVGLGVQSAPSAAFLLSHLDRLKGGDRLVRSVEHCARYAAEDQLPTLVKFARGHQPSDIRNQMTLVRAVSQGTEARGIKLSDDARHWAEEVVGKLLSSRDNDLLQQGADLAGRLKLVSAQQPLAGLAHRKDLPDAQRKTAITALAAIDPKGQVGLLSGIVADGGEAYAIREHASNVLAGINQPESRTELVKALIVAPAKLQNVIAAGLAGSAQGADELLKAVAAGKASARLLQEKSVEVRLFQAKLPDLKERVAKLTLGLPTADQRLNDLIQKRKTTFSSARTDAAAGAKIYEKSCAICHRLGNQGAKIGPQLDGVGNRGVERLLEDIIDPNRNVDQAFRATTLLLNNGQLISGLVLREEGEVVIVADAQGKEVRVPKNTIEQRTVSQLSPMPANLVDQISEADLYHLLAYLLTQKAPPPSGDGK